MPSFLLQLKNNNKVIFCSNQRFLNICIRNNPSVRWTEIPDFKLKFQEKKITTNRVFALLLFSTIINKYILVGVFRSPTDIKNYVIRRLPDSSQPNQRIIPLMNYTTKALRTNREKTINYNNNVPDEIKIPIIDNLCHINDTTSLTSFDLELIQD